MTNKKVHELANDLHVNGKQMVDILGKLNIKVPDENSEISEAQYNTVMAYYKDAVKKIEAKKKAKIEAMKQQEADGQVKVTKEPEVKKQEEAPVAPTAVKVETTDKTVDSKPAEDKPSETQRPNQRPSSQQGNRSYEDRRPSSNDRPNDRRNDRPSGDRPNNRPAGDRPSGDRGNSRPYEPRNTRPGDRPSGDRPNNRPTGDRPSGDRPNNRPVGDRPSGDRPNNRPVGDRPNRPAGDRPSGDRSNNRPFGDRNNSRPGDRTNNRPFDRTNDRGAGARPFDKDKDSDSGNDRRPAGDRTKKKAAPIPEIAAVEKKPERSHHKQNAFKKPEKDMKKQELEEAIHEQKAMQVVAKKKEKAPEKKQEEPVKKTNKKRHKQVDDVVEEKEFIEIPDQVMVSLLAEKLEIQVSDIIKNLFMRGIMATANQEINFELAEEIALEYDMLAVKEAEKDIVEEYFAEDEDDEEDMVKRSPVVVVMGHVDHGKTSLLDALRESNVTASEHGGITQHIGASVVTLASGQNITFLDTPGHEAFTAMRLRGAMATDIAILVVAADDGVMPQTVEAINHAKAAGVQIIVAVNKIDKPGANPDRVLQELTEYELVAEAWGGDTICVQVSALERTNLDELLEMISLVAEMQDYKANPKAKARGTIIEAQLDKGRGPVATVLVQNGTLKVGDAIIAGSAYGRIRAMMDDKGRRVKSAGPSTPVEVLGLSEVPVAGDAFFSAKSEKEARQIADKVVDQNRQKMLQTTPQKVTLDDLFHQIQVGEMKDLNIIVKADTQGSVEAVKQSLVKLSNEEVVIRILHGGVGAITESDVMLASASNAIIIGFNVRPEAVAKSVADRESIDMRLYRVIYNAIEDIEAAMKGMLDPIFAEKITGHIEIRQTFKVSGVGTIGGGFVQDGKVGRNSLVRLNRDNIVIYQGELASLKRFKDDVKEVAYGYECGVMLQNFNDLREGDIVEAFVMEEIPR